MELIERMIKIRTMSTTRSTVGCDGRKTHAVGKIVDAGNKRSKMVTIIVRSSWLSILHTLYEYHHTEYLWGPII